ncbi:MAG: site-specific DNA-methyltransferase [Burkholderiales bacterium PBB3]|nr:MAG: site-specific DNA-methyltransferase [Burkholderiales bacterium PBB3]
MATAETTSLFAQLKNLDEHQLRRLLVEHLTKQKLGLYWESNAIARDAALNADVVLPRVVPDFSHTPAGVTHHRNLVIEGDNFDSLRLLRATHAGKIRVIYIDPPYNTGNKDWVYNDKFVGANDRWRHSQWLEFLYQRLVLARELLTSDGVILVSINDENRSRLELLMDEVFPVRRVGSFVWRSRTGGNDTKGAFHSTNHEHVLIYGNPGFRFSGDEKSYSMYKYQEGDRVYRLSDLTKAHDFRERPNTYYPIIDPTTAIFYPCNPQRVWAYSSAARLKEGQKIRGDTMEEMIAKGLIWFPTDQRVETFTTEHSLREAIGQKDVPMSGTTPLLFEDMPDLLSWVGKKIGYGRPAFKRFKEGLKNETQPISSWLTPKQESETAEEELNMPVVGTTEEGSKELKDLMGDKAFPYPKPPSVIKALLAQATKPNDTILDFFAGSGTTGQAVLELNAEDGGNRRFILCSSTEATAKEPDKNLCRDVCAERLRRVIAGYGGKPGYSLAQGGEFAYLQLDKIEAADVAFEAKPEHATTLISMQNAAVVPVERAQTAIQIIATGDDWLTVICHAATPEAVNVLAALPAQHGLARLAVFCPRPKALAALLAERGVEANTYSIVDALLNGQVRGGQGASA